MRRRISRALLATAAAGATITTLGFAAAGSAGAATMAHRTRQMGDPPSAPVTYTNANCGRFSPFGLFPVVTPGDNCARAGYQANSGRTFRYAQAKILIPNHIGNPLLDPQMYVALDNSANQATFTYARVGITPCRFGIGVSVPACPAGNTTGWAAYFEYARQGTVYPPVLINITSAMQGDRVLVSVYREPSGNQVDSAAQLPDGVWYTNSQTFLGTTFHYAQALADWTVNHRNGTNPSPTPPAPVKVRDTQFTNGAFTTVSGQRGTFMGPWSLTAPEVTSNGTVNGTLIAEPSYLWNAGTGNGDAFGVWRFPF